jgi:putative Mn2+ efflux pump MntP
LDLISIALLAISLSMDAFAVSIGNGITIRNLRPWHAIKTGLFFGVFQALMPTIGWLAGRSISTYIVDYDHWIAFGLLAIIGGKMIWDGFHEEEEDCEHEDPTRTRWLFLLAIATSIDALAAGISLAMVNANIVFSALFIGCTTFALSVLGVMIGKKLGPLFQKKAEFVGGIVLIGIGVKILLEHLMG